MIRRWLALTYYLYALRLAALSHFYFNPLYKSGKRCFVPYRRQLEAGLMLSGGLLLGWGCRYGGISVFYREGGVLLQQSGKSAAFFIAGEGAVGDGI